MKLTNRLGCYALAAAAGLWLAGSVTAADSAKSTCCGESGTSCCGAAQAEPVADASKAKPDLLTTCPVSGEKLGEMGKPFVFVYKEQEVKLCCKSCKKKFDKDPEKYMALIRAADKK